MVVRRRVLILAAVALVAPTAVLTSGSPTVGAATVTLTSAPIDGTNCYYANTWMAPRSATRRHEGVDIIAKAGTKLYAAQRGRVVRSQGSLAGNQVKIVAADGTYFIYAHLSAYADDTAPHGATVEAGAVIGYVGRTGDTTVNHLHFEVHPSGGKSVDPTPVVAAANTCGSKVAQKAVATPSPWANVTTTTPAKSTPTTKPTGAPTTPAPTTLAPTTVAPTTLPPTVAPTTAAPTTAPPTTAAPTTAAPVTTAPPTTGPTTTLAPAPGSKTFNKPVVVQKGAKVTANKAVGVQVVGFPGIPKTAKSVTLNVSMTGSADGRAAIWPCGQKAGLDSGTPLAPLVTNTAAASTVTVGVGDGMRVCLVSSVGATLTVSLAAYA